VVAQIRKRYQEARRDSNLSKVPLHPIALGRGHGTEFRLMAGNFHWRAARMRDSERVWFTQRPDVIFKEDQSRVRRGQDAQNIAPVRRLANLVRAGRGKRSITTARKTAGWDPKFLTPSSYPAAINLDSLPCGRGWFLKALGCSWRASLASMTDETRAFFDAHRRER
jgi:hypothetical protein